LTSTRLVWERSRSYTLALFTGGGATTVIAGGAAPAGGGAEEVPPSRFCFNAANRAAILAFNCNALARFASAVDSGAAEGAEGGGPRVDGWGGSTGGIGGGGKRREVLAGGADTTGSDGAASPHRRARLRRPVITGAGFGGSVFDSLMVVEIVSSRFKNLGFYSK